MFLQRGTDPRARFPHTWPSSPHNCPFLPSQPANTPVLPPLCSPLSSHGRHLSLGVRMLSLACGGHPLPRHLQAGSFTSFESWHQHHFPMTCTRRQLQLVPSPPSTCKHRSLAQCIWKLSASPDKTMLSRTAGLLPRPTHGVPVIKNGSQRTVSAQESLAASMKILKVL